MSTSTGVDVQSRKGPDRSVSTRGFRSPLAGDPEEKPGIRRIGSRFGPGLCGDEILSV